MYRLLLFSPFLLALASADYSWKIMFFHGEVKTLSKEPIQDISWEQCYSICYYTHSCVLAYHSSSGCQFHDFGSVQARRVNSSSRKLIAIKRYIEDGKCPSNASNPLLSSSGSVSDVWNNEGLVYNNTIVSNGSYLTITYSILQCRNDTKLFQRGSVYVCLGLSPFTGNLCNTHAKAVELCSRDGWLTITGPVGKEELNYFLSLVPQYNLKGRTSLIWVDGSRGTFLDDSTGGSSKYPVCKDYSHYDCSYMNHHSCFYVSNYWCDRSNTPSDCFRGATCRMEMIKIL